MKKMFTRIGLALVVFGSGGLAHRMATDAFEDAFPGRSAEMVKLERAPAPSVAFVSCDDVNATRDGVPMQLCRDLAMHCAFGVSTRDEDPGLGCWSNPTLRPARNRVVEVFPHRMVRTIPVGGSSPSFF